MCGLVGVFSKKGNGFDQQMKDAFRTLLMIDTLRGEDSTGAFMVHTNGDVSLAKEASTGPEFVQHKDWMDIFNSSWTQGAALIGHNRKATKGNINDQNAHPFVVDDKIVLVHNGGIFGEHKKLADVEVDSEAIAHLLVKHPIEEALGKFYGAYALIWYDVDREVVNIIRNKERPLWWMECEDCWVWASEKAMLMFTAARVGLKVKVGPILLDEDVLNQFHLKNRTWDTSHRAITLKREYQQYAGSGYTASSANDAANKNQHQAMRAWRDFSGGIDGEDDGAIEDACAFTPANELRSEVEADRVSQEELNRIPTMTVGAQSFGKTSEFELGLAKGCNKIVTMGEFNSDIVNSYFFGKKILCRAFEYVDDRAGGYYLYSSPTDDPMVIFRHHFKAMNGVDEVRVMTMALNGWLFEFQVDTKTWTQFDENKKSHGAAQEGYCVVTTNAAKIIKGGGIKQKEEEHAG